MVNNTCVCGVTRKRLFYTMSKPATTLKMPTGDCEGLQEGLFLSGIPSSKDRKISLIVGIISHLWGLGARKENCWLDERETTPCSSENQQKAGQIDSQEGGCISPLFLKPERSRKGRRGRIMEARITVPVFSLSIHLFTCAFISLMKKGREINEGRSWMEAASL